MHIVLVEDDHFEQEIATFDIGACFQHVRLTAVRNVGDFLLKADTLRDADIVILEHYLPLGELKSSAEETDKWFENLISRFPEMMDPWDFRHGGERLARWMRQNGFNMPILFYTHSDHNDIADDVRNSRDVYWYKKSMLVRDFGSAIQSALRAT